MMARAQQSSTVAAAHAAPSLSDNDEAPRHSKASDGNISNTEHDSSETPSAPPAPTAANR